jgi:nucleoid DNA-binding protein
MKAFIDRIFKKRKHDAEQIKEPIRTEDKATEAMVEAIIEEVKEELKQAEVITKPGHYFNDCNCLKCVRWRNQNAK